MEISSETSDAARIILVVLETGGGGGGGGGGLSAPGIVHVLRINHSAFC